MQQPGRLFSLFKQVISDANSVTNSVTSYSGLGSIESVLSSLPPIELAGILKHARDWNTNAKTSMVAQTLLNTLFKLRKIDDITTAFGSNEVQFALAATNQKSGESLSLNELVQTLIPYTERHLTRMDKLVQESYVVDYLLGEMDGGIFGMDDDLEEEDVMDVDADAGLVA